jgi:MerR family transcriptional regulator, light-induced transcriptional regulator
VYLKSPKGLEMTYPLRTAARLTGLSASVLRAWERRYGVVQPLRTQGGSRRYRVCDLERLQLVKAAVDGGERIGRVAHLDLDELRRRVRVPAPATHGIEETLRALERLDVAEAERLLSLELSARGPSRFVLEFASPLTYEIGERWAGDRLCIASEHLASHLLRVLLGSAMRPGASALRGPRVVFATPPGERHDLGLLMAALVALGAGANPLYLGMELPAEELARVVARAGASALALSIVTLNERDAEASLRAFRIGIPPTVCIWVGGARAACASGVPGIDCVDSFEALEQRVALLSLNQRPQR